MREEYKKQFEVLAKEGLELHGALPLPDDGYWVPEHQIAAYMKWLSSALNLIEVLAPPGSHYARESTRIQEHEDFGTGVASQLFRQTLGLLQAAKEDFEKGLLSRVEYVVAGAAFDDFLDHAAAYHKGNMKNEAAVLAGAVLEDTVKKVAQQRGVPSAGLTLDPLIDALVKANVFTGIKAKRIKAYAGTRNAALHAEWAKFTIGDVGEAIAGTRELIAEFLV